MVTSVDYNKLYFSHPTLSKIHGEPTFSSLKILKKVLKSNASRVTLDLGGGAHGYLGVVLTQAEYLLVSLDTYTRPLHPGALLITLVATHHEANRLTLEHVERFRNQTQKSSNQPDV